MNTLTNEQQKALATMLCYLHYNHEAVIDGKYCSYVSPSRLKNLFAFMMFQSGCKVETQTPNDVYNILVNEGVVNFFKQDKNKKRQFCWIDWNIAEPFCKSILGYENNVYELMINKTN